MQENISVVNISDIQNNSDFNIAVETTGATSSKENPSNDLTNLSENEFLTLTTGNSLIIMKISWNDISPNQSSKKN